MIADGIKAAVEFSDAIIAVLAVAAMLAIWTVGGIYARRNRRF